MRDSVVPPCYTSEIMTEAPAQREDSRYRKTTRGSGIGLVLGLFLMLGLGYILLVPLWEAPDEPAHFYRIRDMAHAMGINDSVNSSYWLIRHGIDRAPPNHPGLALQRQEGFWKKATVVSNYERHQPPLYYMAAAVIFSIIGPRTEPPFFYDPDYNVRQWLKPFFHRLDTAEGFGRARFSLLLIRLFSLFIGAGTLLVAYRLTGLVFPLLSGSPFASGTAALIAFLPQFLFVSSTMNNDGMAVFLSALFFLVLFSGSRGSASGKRAIPEAGPVLYRTALLVVIIIAGTATKPTLAFLTIPAAVFLLLVAPRFRRRAGLILILVSFISLLTLAAGFWYLGLHHGSANFWSPDQYLGRLTGVGYGLLNWSTVHGMMVRLFTSSWSVFGWMSVWPPSWLITGYLVLTLVSIIGLKRVLFPGRDLHPFTRPLFLASLIVLAAVVVKNCFFSFQPQGRFLFPLLPFAAPLVAAGLARTGPKRLSARFLWPAVVFLLGASIYGLFGMILPAYHPPEQRALMKFNMPGESAIMYGQYGAGFRVLRHDRQASRSHLEETGAFRLINPGDKSLSVTVRLTASAESPPCGLEIWNREKRIGQFTVHRRKRQELYLRNVEMDPGENLLFFHLSTNGGEGAMVFSSFVLLPGGAP